MYTINAIPPNFPLLFFPILSFPSLHVASLWKDQDDLRNADSENRGEERIRAAFLSFSLVRCAGLAQISLKGSSTSQGLEWTMPDDGVSQGGLLEKIVRLINEIVILFTFTSQRV